MQIYVILSTIPIIMDTDYKFSDIVPNCPKYVLEPGHRRFICWLCWFLERAVSHKGISIKRGCAGSSIK